MDILSTLDDYELGQICDSLKNAIYNKDEYIIREEELGYIFYILEEGKCKATKEPEIIIKELKREIILEKELFLKESQDIQILLLFQILQKLYLWIDYLLIDY